MTPGITLKLRPFWLIATLLLLSALAFALLHHPEGSSRRKSPPEKITVALTTIPRAALAHIAQARGYFAEEGLQVVTLRFPYGKPALDAVLEGKADVATVAETPIALAAMKGVPLSIVATIHSAKQSHQIVARKDRGVLTPLDLRGKRIGVTHGTSAHFFADVFLVTHGIPLNEVALVNVKPDAMVAALEEGKVDAVCSFEPYISLVRQRLGGNGATFYDEDIYRDTFNVVGRAPFVEKHPESVRKLLRALIRAEDFVRRHPVEAQKHVADQTGFAPEVVRATWWGEFSVVLDQSLILALEDESRWAAATLLPGVAVPNYLDNLYLKGLYSVKPQAVKILR